MSSILSESNLIALVLSIPLSQFEVPEIEAHTTIGHLESTIVHTLSFFILDILIFCQIQPITFLMSVLKFLKFPTTARQLCDRIFIEKNLRDGYCLYFVSSLVEDFLA